MFLSDQKQGRTFPGRHLKKPKDQLSWPKCHEEDFFGNSESWNSERSKKVMRGRNQIFRMPNYLQVTRRGRNQREPFKIPVGPELAVIDLEQAYNLLPFSFASYLMLRYKPCFGNIISKSETSQGSKLAMSLSLGRIKN